MEEQEEKGIDTTYIGIMVVVFLAVVALMVDIGYLYVTDEDLKSAAETASLEGAKVIKQRFLTQIRTEPVKLGEVVTDTVQTQARTAAIEAASGKHHAVAVIAVANKNGTTLADGNDISVGYWDMDSRTYNPGGTPVNAMQVRTRRTAEHETVGLGNLGVILSKMSGSQTVDYTPDAVAAFPPMATAKFALCTDSSAPPCRYPNICTFPARRLSGDSPNSRTGGTAREHYVLTSMLHPPTGATSFSDLTCSDLPPQQVCGSEIYTASAQDSRGLRDLESMMYNPNIDPSNKEFGDGGKATGWWVIAPVADCTPMTREAGTIEKHAVTRYALVRIVSICVNGPAGCQQTGTSFKAPAGTCGGEGEGIFIDQLSFVECGSSELRTFPGLRPVLVK
jgi:hypothetical protein